MITWQLQTAKNRFSELVKEAVRGEPQLVTRNGKPVVYVVDYERYHDRLGLEDMNKKSIFFARPHKDMELELDRDQDRGRRVDL